MGAHQVSLATDPGFLGLSWPGADDCRGIGAFFPRRRAQRVHVRIDRQADEPIWLPEVLRRMRAISALRQDWDGERAKAPTPAALTGALGVLRGFMERDSATPAVVPTPEGGIQFEWHEAGWDVEVEIDPSGAVEAWGEHPGRGTNFFGGVDDKGLRSAIRDISVHRPRLLV